MSRLLVTFSSSYFWYFAVLGLAVPFLAVFLDGRGFNSLEIGEIIALFMATKIIGPTFWAVFADKTGQQLSIIKLGALLSLVSFGLLFWMQGYWPISLTLALFSLFWTAILPQIETMTLASVKRNAKIYARIRLWGSVGFIVLAVVSGEVIEYTSSEAFLWLGFFILSCLWLSTLFLKQPRVFLPTSENVEPILQKILNAQFGCFFLVGMLLQISFGPYYSFWALFLRDLGYPSYAVGLFIGISIVAEIVLFMTLGRVFQRYRITTLITISLLMTGIRWLITGYLGSSVFMLTLAQILHAFSFGLYHSASILYLQRHFNKDQQNRGQAIYIAGVYGLGGAAGAYLAGVLWLDGEGAKLTYLVAGILSLVAGGISLKLKMPSLNNQ